MNQLSAKETASSSVSPNQAPVTPSNLWSTPLPQAQELRGTQPALGQNCGCEMPVQQEEKKPSR